MGAERIRVPVRRAPAAPTPAGGSATDTDWVAVEEPLQIRLETGPAGDRRTSTLTVTMRTPGDDERLAAGLLLAEGVIRQRDDLSGFSQADPNVITVALAPGLPVDLDALRRHLVTGSACGLCGRTTIDAVGALKPPPLPGDSPRVPVAALEGLPAALAARQPGFRDTGGLQAAALFDGAGRLLDVREDVGRHNAVDKLVGGALLEGRLPLGDAGLLVSGRASFEILQKARMAGCAFVVAVGAPSSLAIEFAWESGMTLVGFLREGRCNIYAGPGRIA